jgi:RNA ligase (TIGR02306 family)
MSTFRCEVVQVEQIETIEGADRLELAVVGEYRSVVGKGQYQAGDLIAFIPENSVVPDNILEELNLVGKLGGTRKNRVKARKFLGYLSEGLVYPDKGWNLGDDVTEILGVKKYDPTESLPATMKGRTKKVGPILPYAFKYDIEDFKKYNKIFQEGDEVFVTEKIHGSCTIAGYIPDLDLEFVGSKGQFAMGITIDLDAEENARNLWVYVYKRRNLGEKLRRLSEKYPGEVVYILGEAFGNQDLKYGLKAGDYDFRCFDIRVGKRYVDSDTLQDLCCELDIPTAPIMYQGLFNKEKMFELASGHETVNGTAQIREGVVIKPAKEIWNNRFGRVILKLRSDEYMTRKGGATEFE